MRRCALAGGLVELFVLLWASAAWSAGPLKPGDDGQNVCPPLATAWRRTPSAVPLAMGMGSPGAGLIGLYLKPPVSRPAFDALVRSARVEVRSGPDPYCGYTVAVAPADRLAALRVFIHSRAVLLVDAGDQ